MITNNEIVRVRYLVVYGSNVINAAQPNAINYGNLTIIKWISSHKLIAAMIGYSAVLLIIGISNSRQGYYMRQFLRQAFRNAIDYINGLDFFGLNLIKKWFD